MTVPDDMSAASPAQTEPPAGWPSAQVLDVMDLLGYLYLQHGLNEKAATLIAARLALAPGEARSLRALALAYVRAGNDAGALKSLEQLAQAGHIDASYHLLRAQALHLRGHISDAAVAMQAYVETISSLRILRDSEHLHGLRTQPMVA